MSRENSNQTDTARETKAIKLSLCFFEFPFIFGILSVKCFCGKGQITRASKEKDLSIFRSVYFSSHFFATAYHQVSGCRGRAQDVEIMMRQGGVIAPERGGVSNKRFEDYFGGGVVWSAALCSLDNVVTGYSHIVT